MALNSFKDVQDFITRVMDENKVADAPPPKSPHKAFWLSLSYKDFTTGYVPGVKEPSTGEPVAILTLGNSTASNLILALRGEGPLFAPETGAFGRMPANSQKPFSDEQINEIADGLTAAVPNLTTKIMENQLTITRDITYKTDLKLDVYSGTNSKGAIIDIHGGGWFHGDKMKDEDLATRLAKEGYLVIVPNYRLTPSGTFPAGREDILASLDWLEQSGYEFDRSKIAVWGTSAGGNLSVEVALLRGIPAISWSGIIDLEGFILETDGKATEAKDEIDFSKIPSANINQGGRNDDFLRWCIYSLIGNDRNLLHEATPLTRVSPLSGPMYLANSMDEFVPPSGALKLQRALLDMGIPSTVQLVLGTVHAKGYTQHAIGASLQFLANIFD
jgi:acetyl esterase/lipase